jgi:D-amino-acid dehydrogenase
VPPPRDLRPWAGLRPTTPTGLPHIGRGGAWHNLYLNAGQGMLGFTLAFGSAAQLVACIEGRPSPLPAQALHALRPARGLVS